MTIPISLWHGIVFLKCALNNYTIAIRVLGNIYAFCVMLTTNRVSPKNEADKHNAELQRANPGTKVTG